MGGRAGDLWLSADLDPGGLPHRLVLGTVVPPKLPEDEGEHLGQQQVDLGLVLGEAGNPVGAQVAQAGVLEGEGGLALGEQRGVGPGGVLLRILGVDEVDRRRQTIISNSRRSTPKTIYFPTVYSK